MTMNAPLSTAHFALAAAPTQPLPVAIAHGDGIGPEIMDATLRVLAASGARIEPTEIRIGEALYKAGHSSGIDDAAWAAIADTGLLLKAPITTPLGGGVKSLNVTLRKTLGLYANVRPCAALAPHVPTLHPAMDVVVIRENEEDLYAGIEHRQTEDTYQCLKLVTRSGTERIVRYAFEYARIHGRGKVTAVTKSNIMKLTDGLFDEVFRTVGADYPDIEQDRMIVDIAAARLATRPETFDVIVTGNLYGDILSDIAAEVAGSVGIAPSANIGRNAAMFEAIHGSAPDIAGRDIANPSGLILAAAMMLAARGQPLAAEAIRTAWRRTIEDGIKTADLVSGDGRAWSTSDFTSALIDRIEPVDERIVPQAAAAPAEIAPVMLRLAENAEARELVGIDIFVMAPSVGPDALAARLQAAASGALALTMITNRGVKVWPQSNANTLCTDHWRCRFEAKRGVRVNRSLAMELALRLSRAGLDVIKTETLYSFGGQPGYSLGQGQ
jgi:isocitrate dehydrogenase